METSRQSCQQCERWCEHFLGRRDLSFASSFRLFCLFIYFFFNPMLTPEVVLSWGGWSRYEHSPGGWGAYPASGLQSPRGKSAPCVLGRGAGSTCVLSLCLLRAFSVWAPCHISFLSKVALKKPSSKERLFVLTWLLPFRTEQANGGIYFSHLELNAALSRTSRCWGGSKSGEAMYMQLSGF